MALFSPSFLDCFHLKIVMFNPSKNESSSIQPISISRNFVFTNLVTDMLMWVKMLYGSKLWEEKVVITEPMAELIPLQVDTTTLFLGVWLSSVLPGLGASYQTLTEDDELAVKRLQAILHHDQ